MNDPRSPAEFEYRLPAQIRLDNLAEVRRAGERHIDAHPETVFDLSQLESPGSIVAALLIAWYRYAHLKGRAVEFAGLPVSLRNIIDVSELTDVLPLRDEL